MKNLSKKSFNIMLIITSLFFVMNCKAQSNIVNITDCESYSNILKRDGQLYIKDIDNLYNNYIGTWKWTSSNKEFTITLIKQTMFHDHFGSDNYYKDRMVGYYIYKENGVEIINTTNDNLSAYLPKVDYSLNCYSELTGRIFDVAKNKRFWHTWFEIISPTQIRFKAKPEERLIRQKEGYPELPPVYRGNTFPLEMVLTKQ
jgi:hypothetical protein